MEMKTQHVQIWGDASKLNQDFIPGVHDEYNYKVSGKIYITYTTKHLYWKRKVSNH